MKRFYFTLIALIATLVASAQTVIEVYEYDANGNRSSKPVYTSNKQVKVVFEEHKYVDLGLPSGTLWATCNIGASKPEEAGDYFAWGETATKENYNYSTYKWMNEGQSSWKQINKYTYADGQTAGCWYSGSTFIGDDRKELLPEDDAATANWGNEWCMPTNEQLEELINSKYTTTARGTRNGASYLLVTSKINGNNIIIPAAGYYDSESLSDVGLYGYYWSRDVKFSDNAYVLRFNSSGIKADGFAGRCYGQSIRPVRKEKVERHEYVDLGLPSGTLWATCNIGANSPEQAGDYFAWGETAPKEEYSWSNYKWCEGSKNTMTKYCNSSEWGVVDNKMTLDPEDDAATVNWGTNWCMPTADQIAELTKSDYTTVEFTTMNDVPVLKITSKKNGNSIVLSPAGYWDWVEEEWLEKSWCELMDSYFKGSESWSFEFWSCEHPATVNGKPRQYLAYDFHSFSEFMQYYPLGVAYTNQRCNGLPIRPVRVKK